MVQSFYTNGAVLFPELNFDMCEFLLLIKSMLKKRKEKKKDVYCSAKKSVSTCVCVTNLVEFYEM